MKKFLPFFSLFSQRSHGKIPVESFYCVVYSVQAYWHWNVADNHLHVYWKEFLFTHITVTIILPYFVIELLSTAFFWSCWADLFEYQLERRACLRTSPLWSSYGLLEIPTSFGSFIHSCESAQVSWFSKIVQKTPGGSLGVPKPDVIYNLFTVLSLSLPQGLLPLGHASKGRRPNIW